MSRTSAQKVVDVAEKFDAAKQQFRSAWAEAVRGARTAADTTDTEGWQSIYSGQMDAYKRQRGEIVEAFKPLLDVLERRGWDEGYEKEAADLRKSAIEHRELHDAFRETTLSPIVSAVKACDRVIEEARFSARREEENNPLLAKGLVQAIEDEISLTLAVTFDDKTGRVLLKDRR